MAGRLLFLAVFGILAAPFPKQDVEVDAAATEARQLFDRAVEAWDDDELDLARASLTQAIERLLADATSTSERRMMLLEQAGTFAHELGELRLAERARRCVLEARTKALADDAVGLQHARGNLAITIKALGDLRGACELEERVLEVLAKKLADDDPDLQRARGNLANTAYELGDLRRAKALEEKVLEVCARTLSEDDPALHRARLNLAATLCDLGDLQRARVLLEPVVESAARLLPEGSDELQAARENLAGVLHELGDVQAARALFEQVLAARSRTLPDDHPDLQSARGNLAAVLSSLGDLQGARSLEEKVLEVSTRTLPEDHADLQWARLNLAATLAAQRDYAGARALEEKAVEVFARTLPAEHPDLQTARSNLAATRMALGELDEARALQEQVLEVCARTLPDDHRDLQAARLNLACAIAGGLALDPKDASARARLRELTTVVASGLRRAARTAMVEGSSREAEERIASLGGDLSLLLSLADGDPGEAFLASEVVRSGALISGRIAAAAGSDPELDALRDRRRAAVAELTRIARDGADAATYPRTRSEIDAVERALVLRGAAAIGSAATALDPTVEQLAAVLSPADAIVAFRRYARWTRGALPSSGGASIESFCAFVLRRGEKGTVLSRVELGPIAAIDAAVTAWRGAIGIDRRRGAAALGGGMGSDEAAERLHRGRELRALVIDPLEAALAGATRWIVVLDDVLHAVPLDALPSKEADEPLGTSLRIEPRASLLELLLGTTPLARDGILLAAAPVSFGVPPADASSETSPDVELPDDGALDRAWDRAFLPLPGSLDEIRSIAITFEEAFPKAPPPRLLERRAATRDALFELARSARWFHVATHGWFAPESIVSRDDPRPLDARSGLGARLDLQERVRGTSPMLLCGIALAGANLPQDARGVVPGVLTAEELATLDLSGCELAVLSACDTNVGVRRAGQGVASLQRALHLAGARSVVTSLWKVPDEATKELMADFCRRTWADRKPKGQALWEAKMKLRAAKDELGRPRYSERDWAGWLLTGDPR